MGFYDALSAYYDRLFPAGAAQVEFVAGRLPEATAGDGVRVLDVAAGTGNLAVELCKRGWEVTALDLDAAMVRRMADKRRALALPDLTPLHMDMRRIDSLPPQSFAAALCVGNSIVHLASLAEIGETIAKMAHLLKPDGALILQTVNYDRILQQGVTSLPALAHSDGESAVTFLRSYDLLDDGQVAFHGHLLVERGGQTEQFRNTVRLVPLRRGDLERMVRAAGLDAVEVCGSFKGEPYGPDSPATVVTARKLR